VNYDSYIESRAFEDEYLEERRKRRERQEERAELESDRRREGEPGCGLFIPSYQKRDWKSSRKKTLTPHT